MHPNAQTLAFVPKWFAAGMAVAHMCALACAIFFAVKYRK
jgi:hypothetical protein